MSKRRKGAKHPAETAPADDQVNVTEAEAEAEAPSHPAETAATKPKDKKADEPVAKRTLSLHQLNQDSCFGRDSEGNKIEADKGK